MDLLHTCAGPSWRGEFHQALGWREIPGSNYFLRRHPADGWTHHTHDDDGFRVVATPQHTCSRNFILLGDSFAYGINANNEETIAARLEHRFRRTGALTQGVCVHNFGMEGFGTAQSLAALKTFGENRLQGQQPLVILGYYLGNDLLDNLQKSNNRPLYQLEGEKAALIRPPRATWKNGTSARWLNANIRSVQLLELAVKRHSLHSNGDILGTTIEQGQALTQALLTQLADTVRTMTTAQEGRLLIVVIPEKQDIYQEHPEIPPLAPSRKRLYEVQRQGIAELARERHDVDVIDLKEPIAAAARLKDVYGVKDNHFSPYGYAVAADHIARWIVAEGLLPPGDNVPYEPPTASRNTPTCEAQTP